VGILFLILSFLSFVTLIAGIVLLAFKAYRQRAKRIASASGALFLISFVAMAVVAVREGTSDKEAQQLGFANSDELQKAREIGVTDPKVFRERRQLAEEVKAKEKQALNEAKANEQHALEAQKRKETELREALLKMPLEEERFIYAVEEGRKSYKAAQTDLQRGAARPARARALCAASSSPQLKDWVGKISRLTTNSSGEGVLSVEISSKVQLVTLNNSFSDSAFGTMIASGSSLYQRLLEMKVGDAVRFDASLFSSGDDCYKEISLTMAGALQDPEFVAKFTRVNRIALPTK